MDTDFLKQAIKLSGESVANGGFPVGVVIVRHDTVLSTGVSNGKQLNDPTSHAEIAAIRDATTQLGTRHLKNTTLYSSMEPCLMCWSASTWASIPRIIFAASRERLSPMHFEGSHTIGMINQAARKPIELTHDTDLEPTALAIIAAWEQTI